MPALVGSVGAGQIGTQGVPVTPAWGTDETRIAGHLLVCWARWDTGGLSPSTPSGWSRADYVGGGYTTAAVFYKVAAGGDAAPTIQSFPNTEGAAQLAEFSGVAGISDPLDRHAGHSGLSSPVVATCAGADQAASSLVVYNGSMITASASSVAVNNGVTNHDTLLGRNVVIFGWGISTGNGAADTATLTYTGSPYGGEVVLASFKAASRTGLSMLV